MLSRSLAHDKIAVSRSVLALIIVVLVVSSSAAGFFLLQQPSNKTILSGSKFNADYIGSFQDGRVFDTSLFSVVSDNTTYPKSLTFQWSNNSSKYSPLDFEQGSSSLIQGFSKGVLGMTVGEWRNFTVIPSEGYAYKPSALRNITLNATVPIFQWMTFSEFNARCGLSSSNVPGLNYFTKDLIWGWNVVVTQVNSTTKSVRVQNLATEGAEYNAYSGLSSSSPVGWKLKVLSYNATFGEIMAQHLIDSTDARKVKGYDPISKKSFVLDNVNADTDIASVYLLDFKVGNQTTKEVDGQTLVFTVHVISIG